MIRKPLKLVKRCLVVLGLLLSAPALSQFSTPNTWALVVGISDYQSENIQDLNYAHLDAANFCKYLHSSAGGKVDTAHVKLMINDQAKAGNIIYEGFQWLFDNAQNGDRVIVYFSGHGNAEAQSIMEMGYLLTYDWEDDNHFGLIGTLPSDRLQGWLESLSVKNGADVWLIVDACRSAKFNQGNSLINALNKDWGNITKIVSSEKGANSFEDKRWGNGSGAFTHYLLNGLYGMADEAAFGNNNGKVELFELEQYLKIEVTKNTNFQQIPSVTSNDLHQVMGRVHQPTLELLKKDKLASDGITGDFESNKGMIESQVIYTENFYKALNENKLVGTESALSIMMELKALEETSPSQINQLENSLLAAIHIQTSKKLNQYLNGEVGLINNQWKNGIADLLSAAMTLVEKDDVLYKDLATNKLFIEAAIDYENGDSEKALGKLDSAMEIDSFKAYIHNLLGMTYYDLGQFSEAENHLKQAIKLSNGWQYPYTNLGNVYAHQRKDLLAIKKYKQSVEIEPQDSYPLNNLANVLTTSGQPKQAIKYYQQAIDIDPNYSSALIGLGNAYYALENYVNAKIYYRKAIDADSLAVFAYQNLGTVYAQQNQLKEAIKIFKEGLKIDKANVELLTGLAVVYEKLKRWEDMLNILLRLYPQKKDDLAINYTLGKLYVRNKNDNEAMNYLEKCTRLKPNYYPAYESLSGIYKRRNNAKLAWEYNSKAIQLRSENFQNELYLRSQINSPSDLNPYRR